MTQISELTDTVELNPDAPQPPFPLFLELPGSWTLLDTNQSTWERSAQDMLDTTFHRSKLSAKERREVLGFFDQLVADCQQAGAALSLIQVGRLSAGGAASLGIHLAFGDEGQPANLAAVQDSLPRNGTITEIASGVGPALLHTERMTMVPPGATELVALTSMQIFVPIPDTTWTAVFATASAYPELTEPVERLLRAIVAGFRRDEVPLPAEAAQEPADPAEFTPAPRSKGPGIERGFTTLVRKRIDPADPAGAKTEDDAEAEDEGRAG